MKRKHQKYRLCEICYCHPRLNRKLLIIKNSFDEVYKILNSDFCSRKHSDKQLFILMYTQPVTTANTDKNNTIF